MELILTFITVLACFLAVFQGWLIWGSLRKYAQADKDGNEIEKGRWSSAIGVYIFSTIGCVAWIIAYCLTR